MNKDMRYITILIIGISLIGTISFVNNFDNIDTAFNENVTLGDKAYKKEIYIDAIEYYGEASKSNPCSVCWETQSPPQNPRRHSSPFLSSFPGHIPV